MVIFRISLLFEYLFEYIHSKIVPKLAFNIFVSEKAQHVDFLTALMYRIHLMHTEWVLSDELMSVTSSLGGGQSVPNCNLEPRLCNVKWWKFTGRRSLALCWARIICLCHCLVCTLVRDTKPVFYGLYKFKFSSKRVAVAVFLYHAHVFLSVLAENLI
jgi:hypothetical protein